MIPGRRDYNLLNTEEDPIPPQEPVFILRAQDTLAEVILRFYAVLLETELHNPVMARQVREHADLFAAWPTKKRPDLPPAEAARYTRVPGHCAICTSPAACTDADCCLIQARKA